MESDRPRSRSRSRARREAGWFVEADSRGETPDAEPSRRRRKRRHRSSDAADHFEREDEPKDVKEEFSLALVVLLAVGIVMALCLAYVFQSIESEPPF